MDAYLQPRCLTDTILAAVPKELKKEIKAAARVTQAALQAASPAIPSNEEANAAAKVAPAPSKEAKKIKCAAKLPKSDAEKELKTQNKDILLKVDVLVLYIA